jgi:molybdenum cofactor cytidylyltransferase
MKTGAIILADHTSERIEIDIFKPMAHLAGTTVIKKAITTLRQAGISPILVVTGYQSEILERHISHHGTACIYNKHFEDNSLIASMKLGLSHAEEECEQVLCLPVDAALFSVDTVKKLADAEEDADIVIPCWEEQAGFPILVRKKGAERIQKASEEGEWLDCLRESGAEISRLPVDDRGVTLRIRDKNEYETAIQYAKELRDANALKFDLKVFLAKEEHFFGPGVAHFLLTVEEKGSMLAACQEMNMSYSKGWKMVKTVEDEMGFPFLIRQTGGSSGGSSRLTEEGREFIRRYQALQRDAYKTAEAFFSLYFSDFQ